MNTNNSNNSPTGSSATSKNGLNGPAKQESKKEYTGVATISVFLPIDVPNSSADSERFFVDNKQEQLEPQCQELKSQGQQQEPYDFEHIMEQDLQNQLEQLETIEERDETQFYLFEMSQQWAQMEEEHHLVEQLNRIAQKENREP